jgi:predicted kinase
MTSGNFPTSQPALIVLSGYPGTGKTTFAHRLTSVLDFEHVESDALRRSLAAQPTYSAKESAAVFRRAEERLARALDEGRHALLDATSLTSNDRRAFVRLARRHGARLIIVRLTVPREEARQRLSGTRQGHSQANIAVYDQMQGRAQLISQPHIVVDTRFDLAPSIALVVRLVQK